MGGCHRIQRRKDTQADDGGGFQESKNIWKIFRFAVTGSQ